MMEMGVACLFLWGSLMSACYIKPVATFCGEKGPGNGNGDGRDGPLKLTLFLSGTSSPRLAVHALRMLDVEARTGDNARRWIAVRDDIRHINMTR